MQHYNTKQQFLKAVAEEFGSVVSRQDLLSVASRFDVDIQFVTLKAPKVARGVYDISQFLEVLPVDKDAEPVVVETDEDIIRKQRKRFKMLDRMVDGVINGSVRSLIVSGPAGIGKTYTIESSLESANSEGFIQYEKVCGYVKASGLYKILWENREKNQVILIDDADSAFNDETALNILKAALDTSKRRTISWRSEKSFADDLGNEIPKSFDFNGSVIFITNLDFERLMSSTKQLAPHFSALMSRSFYLDLNLASQHEYMLRIFDVLDNSSMKETLTLNEAETKMVKEFLIHNKSRMRELSLRIVTKLAGLVHIATSKQDFFELAEASCLRRK
jgi:hypothetical protein